MKKPIVLVLFLVTASAFGVGKGGRITRGGFGFLFPDHNSFSNPGQFALERGLAFEATYEQSGGTNTATAIPSIVFGNGTFGVGLFNNRTGTDITSGTSSTDTLGGGMGLSLAKERLTIGVGIERSIDEAATSNGTIQGTVTLNGMKRAGFSMGAGFGSTLSQIGGDVMSGTVAMGYGAGALSLEAVGAFNNLSDFSDVDLSGYLNLQSSAVYFAAGYTRGLSTQSNTLKGRLGFVLGGLDLSGFMHYPIESSSNMSFGGSLRIAI